MGISLRAICLSGAAALALSMSVAQAAPRLSPDDRALLDNIRAKNPARAQQIETGLAEIDKLSVTDGERVSLKQAYLNEALLGGDAGDIKAQSQTAALVPPAGAPPVATQAKTEIVAEGDADPEAETAKAGQPNIQRFNLASSHSEAPLTTGNSYNRTPDYSALGQAPLRENDNWDVALRYAGEFAGFRVSTDRGYGGRENINTFAQELDVIKGSNTSEYGYSMGGVVSLNLRNIIEPIRLWDENVPKSNRLSLGFRYSDGERKSSWDEYDPGNDHRFLLVGLGDPLANNPQGYSFGPGSNFNLVTDLRYREDINELNMFAKYAQDCYYGLLAVTGYALLGYSHVLSDQRFDASLPNVNGGVDFRYDTTVNTRFATIGLGLKAERSFGPGSNFSVYGGGFVGADIVRARGWDKLDVSGFIDDFHQVSLREGGIHLGWEAQLGARYKFAPQWSADLGANYGSHRTGSEITRTGTEFSDLDLVRKDQWGVGLGLNYAFKTDY